MRHLSSSASESTSPRRGSNSAPGNEGPRWLSLAHGAGPYVLAVALLALLNLTLHAPYFHTPRVLYSDELVGYLETYANPDLSLWDKVLGTEVIRPIPRLVCLALYSLCDGNYTLINDALLLLNLLVCLTLFACIHLCWAKGGDRRKAFVVSLTASCLYLVSEFMQCQIFSILGVMEGLGHAATLVCAAAIVFYLRDGRNAHFLLAAFSWVFATLCHERFVVLAAAIVLAAILRAVRQGARRRVELVRAALVVFVAICYALLRATLLQANALRGTNGGSVSDATPASLLKNLAKSMAYLLNINAGPEMRNGVSFRDVPAFYDALIAIGIVSLLVIGVLFVMGALRSHASGARAGEVGMVLLCALCCMLASSTAGEPALRFVYAPYSLCLLAAAGMVLSDGIRPCADASLAALLLYAVCTFPVQMYYRTEIGSVSLWPQKTRAESLYDSTLGSYGTSATEKAFLVVDREGYLNQYGKGCWKFFQPYLGEERLEIRTYRSLPDALAEPRGGQDVLLVLDEESGRFLDLTELLATDGSK